MSRPALALLVPLALALSARADVKKFGQPLGDAPSVPLVQLLKSPDAWAGKRVRTEGTVAAVCARKGCWMTLGEGEKGEKGEKSDQSVRVTFKDYGFFVPKTAAGQTAVLEGTFSVKTIPEATAKHYAGETPGGKPDAIHGDQKELSFVATGVELRGP